MGSRMGEKQECGRGCLLTLTERYFELLKDAKVKGYLFAQQNYIPKE